jgi:hypothetical protein
MTMQKRVSLLGLSLLVVMSVASCERAKGTLGAQGYAYEGAIFKGKLNRHRDDRSKFSVSVRGASRGVAGALEAARIEANRYCIEQYGNTAILWEGQGPDTDPEGVTLSDGGILSLSGRCSGW